MDALIKERLENLRQELEKINTDLEAYVRDRMLYMQNLAGQITALEALLLDAPVEKEGGDA